MKDILPDLNRWLAEGQRIALATVVQAEGPSPRPVGAHMAMTDAGQMAGSVSGGCVEGAVYQEAQEVLDGLSQRALRRKGIDPAWVEERVAARNAARAAKDFAQADALRAELTAKGIEIMDTPEGTRWRLF